jgi:hypothetical protein
MTTTAKAERIKVITPEFRVSYPSLFQARKVDENNPNEKAKFSVAMIFRVAETEDSKKRGEKVVDLKPLKDAVAKILLEKLGPDWQKKVQERKSDGTPMYRLPFRDGNAAETKDKDGYGPGTVYIRASSQYKPGVVDAQKVEVMNPQDVYGGCYARASIHPYWYSAKGNQGVTFGLDNVQKLRDGEPFSGRTRAEDDFDSIEAPAGAVSTNADPFA